MAKGQSGVQDLQQQESSPVGSPYGEDPSLNVDESVNPDVDAEVEHEGEKVKGELSEQQYSHMEERHEEEEDDEEEEEDGDEEENEIKIINQDEGETREQSQFRDRLSEEHRSKSWPEKVEKSAAVALNQTGSAQHRMRKKVKQFCSRDIRSRERDNKDLNCWKASALKIPCSLTYVESSFLTI